MTEKEPTAHWRQLIDKQTRSGLSAYAFCRKYQIKSHQFYRWRRRIERGEGPNQIQDGFLELTPFPKHPRSGIRICMEEGLSIEIERGFDPLTLHSVVETLCRKRAVPC